MEGHDSLLGLWLLDQYRLVAVLGSGGMGQVYLAEQPSMDRYAAIKIMRPSRGQNQDTSGIQTRFRQEARTISRLSHPNIVMVYNFGELTDGLLFLAMEYVEGSNLRTVLADGPLPLLRAINLTYQCADALAHAHSRRVVHRDFKPDNVMLTKLMGRDHVKVLDFGIARLLEATSITEPNAIVGTPEFLSPEQCRGEKATSYSDQYSLGLVFYAMLTGKPALFANGVFGYIEQHLNVTPQPPSQLREGIELLDPIVMRMIAKRAEDRFACMEEVQKALDLTIQKLQKQKAAAPVPPASPGGVRRAPTPFVSEPTRVAFLESSSAVDDADWELFQRNGIKVRSRCLHRDGVDLKAADLWVLSVNKQRLRDAIREWTETGVPRERMLICLDAPVTSLASEDVLDPIGNLVVGNHPLDSTALTVALQWMTRPGGDCIHPLARQKPVEVLQIGSVAQKSYCMDLLREDLESQGVRRLVKEAVQELGEEMIMNALLHAPVRADGQTPPKRDAIVLPPGQEAIFRWTIADHFVALTVRDCFGTITSTDVMSSLLPSPSPRKRDSGGAGLGLRIMSRAAHHLFFFITPGKATEVLALVDRHSATSRRCLCVVQGSGLTERRIGDRLFLIKTPQAGGLLVQVRGVINETSDLSEIFSCWGPVVLDLSQVTAVSSMGIQAWMEASRKRSSGLELVLERCSISMVRQFNLLKTFAETGTIRSFFAPYRCSRCEKDSSELLCRDDLGKARVPPRRRCASCGMDLEFEDSTEAYFSFL